MPLLDHGTKADFQKNVATETKAKEAEGYSPKKANKIAVAIAYSVKRRHTKKKR